MTGWIGQTGTIRLKQMLPASNLFRPHGLNLRLHGAVIALALVLIALITTVGAIAEDNVSAPVGKADAPVSSASVGTEAGSQVKTGRTVSHEQEIKDRLFVDSTLIASAVIMAVIAFLIFASMPKPPKKASNDSK